MKQTTTGVPVLRVIRPEAPLSGDAARFEPDQTADLIAIGTRDAENHKGW